MCIRDSACKGTKKWKVEREKWKVFSFRLIIFNSHNPFGLSVSFPHAVVFRWKKKPFRWKTFVRLSTFTYLCNDFSTEWKTNL